MNKILLSTLLCGLVLTIGMLNPTYAFTKTLVSSPNPNFATFCKWTTGSLLYKSSNLTATDTTDWNLVIPNWNDVPSGATLSKFSGSTNIVYYSVNNPNVSWDGLTSYTCNGSGNFVSPVNIYINDHFTNGYGREERQSVIAHETGHSLGLAHTTGATLMNGFTCGTGSRWCTYSIFVPVLDDINGVQNLYGSTSTTAAKTCVVSTADTPSCTYGGSNGYPIQLKVSSAATGAYAFTYPGGSAVSLPSSNTLMMLGQVTPNTLYRYSMGIYTATNPYNTSNRFMTIEVDNTGFNLVGSSSTSIGSTTPSTGTTYVLELVAENGLPAAGYVFTSSGTYIGTATLSPSLGWSTSVYYGHGVWTDTSSNPASNYSVNAWYNYLF